MERKLNIATGKSRFTKTWENRAVTWEWLRNALQACKETSESAEEYKAMTKEKQDSIKDVGGYVGGYLREGRRSKHAVMSRSVVTLDYDDFSAEQLEGLRSALAGYNWAVHSTHKHREDAWRVRIAVPLDQDARPEEYAAVARRIAEMIGMKGIDGSTFEASRLMYWGSRSQGAPWLFDEGKGDFISKDKILRSYNDWRDCSEWPLTEKEQRADLFAEQERKGAGMNAMSVAGRHGKVQDPTEKDGLIGAFCRTYDIYEAVEKFLGNVYERRGNNFHLIGSDTGASAKVREDGRFMYSFHATDPVCGLWCNAWDLVRIHKFGNEDYGSTETRSERMPSFRKMEELAMNDPKVKSRFIEEKMKKAVDDFDGFESADDGSESSDESEWLSDLEVNKKGDAEGTPANVKLILMNDPRIAGRIKSDDFTGSIKITDKLPWRTYSDYWMNDDDACLRNFFSDNYKIKGATVINDGFTEVMRNTGRHEVVAYLDSLTWDGEERLGRLFTDLLGAEKTELNREICKLFFVAAVRRVRNHRKGVKFDYCPILHGPEGCYKSTLFSIMGGEWYSSSQVTIEGKEGMQSLQGVWIAEFGELASIKKSEVDQWKKYISNEVDKFRPAYGKKEEWRPRQCVMAGTTNEEYFLKGIDDKNRRFPVVEINPALRTITENPREWLIKWRDQLWAEASELEKNYGPLYLESRHDEEIRRIQDLHNLDLSDPTFPEIERFLDFYLPFDWAKRTEGERKAWMDTVTDPTVETGFTELRQTVNLPEIMRECLEISATHPGYKSMSRSVGKWLNKHPGWKRVSEKRSIYGTQKTWIRMSTEQFSSVDKIAEEALNPLFDL